MFINMIVLTNSPICGPFSGAYRPYNVGQNSFLKLAGQMQTANRFGRCSRNSVVLFLIQNLYSAHKRAF